MIIEMTGVTNSSAFQKLEDESNVLSSDHRNLSTEHTEDTEDTDRRNFIHGAHGGHGSSDHRNLDGC